MDWNLKFTNAFRTDEIQKIVDNMFKGKPRMKISKEEFEQIVVQVCSLVMQKVYKDD